MSETNLLELLLNKDPLHTTLHSPTHHITVAQQMTVCQSQIDRLDDPPKMIYIRFIYTDLCFAASCNGIPFDIFNTILIFSLNGFSPR